MCFLFQFVIDNLCAIWWQCRNWHCMLYGSYVVPYLPGVFGQTWANSVDLNQISQWVQPDQDLQCYCETSIKQLLDMSQRMTKPTKWHVRTAKTQISLGTCPIWSESWLSAWRKLGSLAFRRFLFRRGLVSAMQTRSYKSCHPFKIRRKIYQMYQFPLTLVMLNRLRCHAHFKFPANQITWSCFWYKSTYLMTNSIDPDQLASSEANWSGSTLFAKTVHVVFSMRRVNACH